MYKVFNFSETNLHYSFICEIKALEASFEKLSLKPLVIKKPVSEETPLKPPVIEKNEENGFWQKFISGEGPKNEFRQIGEGLKWLWYLGRDRPEAPKIVPSESPKKFQEGGIVPETGLVYAHAGETVIPRDTSTKVMDSMLDQLGVSNRMMERGFTDMIDQIGFLAIQQRSTIFDDAIRL